MTKKCKNTLYLVCEILFTQDLQSPARLIQLLTKPLYDAHSHAAGTLRKPEHVLGWYLQQAPRTTNYHCWSSVGP
eukprot:12880321-Prorocentrum_lima.AAC.1